MASNFINCINCGSADHKLLFRAKNYESYNFNFLDRYINIVVCKNCGLTFINPRSSDEDYVKYYAESGKLDGEVTASKEQILAKKKYQKLNARWLAEKIQPSGDIKVLDVGCGLATFLYWLQELGFSQVEGLDFSRHASKFAQEKFNIPVYTENFFAHNSGQEQFDLVTALATMEHFTNPLLALQSMNKLMKPGAYLYINVPDLNGMSFKTGISTYFKFVHTYYYTKKTLSGLLEQAGFAIRHVWEMPPIVKYATYLYPDNRVCGELNIIAQKSDMIKREAIEKDDYKSIIKLFRKRRRQDYLHALCYRLIWSRVTGPIMRKFRNCSRKEYVYKDIIK